MGRLLLAFTEIALAVFVVSSSVVVGHELKAWRAWYWDPETVRPWEPTPQPSPSAIAAPSPQATPAVAAAAVTTTTTTITTVSAPFTVPVAVAGFASPHLCRPPTDN